MADSARAITTTATATATAAAPTLRVVLWHSPAPGQVCEQVLHLPPGARLADALAAVHWPTDAPYGIWGRRVPLEHPLHDGDRLERYRPLTVDPKVARRQRFAQQGARASGLFAQRRPHSKAGY